MKSVRDQFKESFRKTEGTWSTPETPEQRKEAKALIAELEAWTDKAYGLLGDDELFDHLGAAVDRAKKLMSGKWGTIPGSTLVNKFPKKD